MPSYRDITTLTKRSLVFYMLAACVFVEIAATKPGAGFAIDSATRVLANESGNRTESSPGLAIQKSISNKNYDVDGVIRFAKSLAGTPHVMGGYSAKGIDCSGLVKLAHEHVNVNLPRSSHDQAKFGTIIKDRAQLQRGDIVFFHSTYKKNHLITHTGIYVGNNEFIHTSSKRGVTISKLDSDYYKKHYLFGTRLSR